MLPLDPLLACLASCLPDSLRPGVAGLLPLLQSGVAAGSVSAHLPDGELRRRLASGDPWGDARRILEWCAGNGVRILYPGHPDYPARFSRFHEGSAAGSSEGASVLFVRGEPPWRSRIGLGIVGSRSPTAAALAWMDAHLPPVLSNPGVYSISGGARGVDQKAHALSLRVGCPTVAFLPSGLARIYPAEFIAWADAVVASGGALVTEYPPSEPMRKCHFHRRNRLIARLGAVCLVAEAARKSGTLITARYAKEAGVPVAVLPASPLEPKAMGSLDLLFEGAQPLRDARDLGEFLALNARLDGG